MTVQKACVLVLVQYVRPSPAAIAKILLLQTTTDPPVILRYEYYYYYYCCYGPTAKYAKAALEERD